VSNRNGSADTLPDNNTRAIMRGAFLIEAEDFNYGGGQTVAAASTMPYAGNAYINRESTLDVDFFSDPDNAGGAAFAYNRFDANDTDGVVEMKGPADPADYLRGDFSVTANYALGWTSIGEWQNYTRTFPAGNYVAYLGGAHDGRGANEINMILSKVARPTVADNSVIGTVGGGQGLTKLGQFLGPATGAWSSNDLFPLREGDGTGPIVQFPLSGTETLRLTFNATDGDADFILLYKVDGGTGGGDLKFNPITVSGNNVTLSWTGTGGTLLVADSVAGPWTPAASQANPQTVAITGNTKFWVLRR
jgi:hypothetical protein